jgi:hypothetical protein
MWERVPPKYSQVSAARPMLAWGLAVVAFATVAAVLFAFNPAEAGFYPFCLFHRTTGLLCPGCGSLRALHQLLHGHLLMALRCNALLVLSIPIVVWFGLRVARRRAQHATATGSAVRPYWIWASFGVLLVFSVLRNLPFAQLAWLSP